MKTLYLSALLLVGLFAITSCGIITNEMDSEKTIAKINKMIDKHVDTDNYKILRVWFKENDELSNSLGFLAISLKGKDGKHYNQSIVFINGQEHHNEPELEKGSGSSMKSGELSFDDQAGINHLDPQLIISQINDAKNQIPEEYSFRSVGEYTIEADRKTDEKTCTFVLNVTEKGNATSIEGKNIVTTYYEIKFTGLPDGTALMEEEE